MLLVTPSPGDPDRGARRRALQARVLGLSSTRRRALQARTAGASSHCCARRRALQAHCGGASLASA